MKFVGIEIGGSEQRTYSYSQFTSWLTCGVQYWLSRLVHVDELPACYLVGGRAVHTCTEDFDRALWQVEQAQRGAA